MIKNLHNFSCKDDTTRKEATERGKQHMGPNKIFPLYKYSHFISIPRFQLGGWGVVVLAQAKNGDEQFWK
jgi:hypothetical protein